MTSFAHVLSVSLILALSIPAKMPPKQEQIGLEILITVSLAVNDREKTLFDPKLIEIVISDYGGNQSDFTENMQVSASLIHRT